MLCSLSFPLERDFSFSLLFRNAPPVLKGHFIFLNVLLPVLRACFYEFMFFIFIFEFPPHFIFLFPPCFLCFCWLFHRLTMHAFIHSFLYIYLHMCILFLLLYFVYPCSENNNNNEIIFIKVPKLQVTTPESINHLNHQTAHNTLQYHLN